MLTVLEAAERLNVHPETIRRMIRRGELGAMKIGHVYRINPDDLTPTRVEVARPAAAPEPASPLARFVQPEWRHPDRAAE